MQIQGNKTGARNNNSAKQKNGAISSHEHIQLCYVKKYDHIFLNLLKPFACLLTSSEQICDAYLKHYYIMDLAFHKSNGDYLVDILFDLLKTVVF